jgi:hypothetical protein
VEFFVFILTVFCGLSGPIFWGNGMAVSPLSYMKGKNMFPSSQHARFRALVDRRKYWALTQRSAIRNMFDFRSYERAATPEEEEN